MTNERNGEVTEEAQAVEEPLAPALDADDNVVEPPVEVIDDKRDELAERTADLQRLTAEYANYRRRVERDKKAVVENAKISVLGELLGVLDDLDRARAHGDLDSGPLKSVADKLVGVLEKQGVTVFGAEGDAFDPTLHEAVQHEGEGHDPVIGAVFRKGYRVGDRVLRHAMVAVTDGVGDVAVTDAGSDAEPDGQ